MSAPSVGPDGSVYFSRSLGYLESVTPAGQSRWTFFDGSIVDHPAVSPDGSVVVAGVRPNFGEPGLVRAWNAATGAVAWQVGLENVNGGYQIAYTQPRFSADGRTAYFGTAVLGGDGESSFVYAVGSGTASPPPPPPPPPPTAQCVVPGVVGLALATARTRIGDARCSVGTIKRVRSKQVGIVLGQSPAPGTVLPQGSPVSLTVGRR
jgi:hypothetical protein